MTRRSTSRLPSDRNTCARMPSSVCVTPVSVRPHSTVPPAACSAADEKSLVIVLGIDEHEGVRTQAAAEIGEGGVEHFAPAAGRPAFAQMQRVDTDAGRRSPRAQGPVAIELERARVDGHGARVFAGTRTVVDQPERHVAARKIQRQDESCRSGAGDQDGRPPMLVVIVRIRLVRASRPAAALDRLVADRPVVVGQFFAGADVASRRGSRSSGRSPGNSSSACTRD